MSRNVDDVQPAPRGRPRDARVDEAILGAALALFARGGVEAVTFDGVATRAQVSRSAVYRRWRSREALVGAALAGHRDHGERGAEDWESASSIVEVMALFTDRAVRALTDPLGLGLLAQVQALDQASPIRQVYWATIVEPRRRAFGQMVVAAREHGKLAPGPDPDVLQDLLAGALSYRALSHPDPPDEAEARRYVDSVLQALGLTHPPGR